MVNTGHIRRCQVLKKLGRHVGRDPPYRFSIESLSKNGNFVLERDLAASKKRLSFLTVFRIIRQNRLGWLNRNKTELDITHKGALRLVKGIKRVVKPEQLSFCYQVELLTEFLLLEGRKQVEVSGGSEAAVTSRTTIRWIRF